MKFSQFNTCFAESNVHGLPFIVNPKITYCERFFWLVVIILSIVYATMICHNQWNRFSNNPIVLSIETNHRNWFLKRPGVTVCGHYFNETLSASLIQKYWNINTTNNDKQFQFYNRFMKQIAFSTYTNLSGFEEYIDDNTLDVLDLENLVIELQGGIIETSDPFVPVLTELGVCYSTTHILPISVASSLQTTKTTTCIECQITLNYMSEKIDYNHKMNKSKPEDFLCSSTDLCMLEIIPGKLFPVPLSMYLHNEMDVMNVGKNRIDLMLMSSNTAIQLNVDWVVASGQIRDMSVQQRKCLYYSEPLPDSHYSVYTRTLCEINCRMKAAFRQCDCKPFFYAAAKNETKCSVKGLACLAEKEKKSNWLHARCKCPEECELIAFRIAHKRTLVSHQYDRNLNMQIFLPKKRVRRGVVFSVDSLIVSLGGAAALFLGCSFISLAELVFFFVESIFYSI